MDVNVSSLGFVALQRKLRPALERVETELQHAVRGGRDLTDELTSHLAEAGGKRMRPLLCLLCAQLGTNPRADGVLKAAVTVELTHIATLYHDDVMDSAPVRRGAAAAHEIWGNNRAILAGDLLLARASHYCAELGPRAVRYNAVTFERLCNGQLNETFGCPEGEDPVEFYLQVLADKTGSLVNLSAYFGALAAGADDSVCEMVARYGDRVGVAFQLADDVLDIVSDSKQSGKTPGTDLREGVDTMPILLLRQAAQRHEIDAAGQEILHTLDTSDLQDDEVLSHLVDQLRVHPVMDQVRQLARHWVDEAVAELADLQDTRIKEALVAFANTLVDRKS